MYSFPDLGKEKLEEGMANHFSILFLLTAYCFGLLLSPFLDFSLFLFSDLCLPLVLVIFILGEWLMLVFHNINLI